MINGPWKSLWQMALNAFRFYVASQRWRPNTRVIGLHLLDSGRHSTERISKQSNPLEKNACFGRNPHPSLQEIK